jgi:probable HAF family extracellular repeat protein
VSASSGLHGFLLSGGTYTTLDGPSATETVAAAINDAGQIVGTYVNNTGAHGFLYNPNGGTYITLDDPLAGITHPLGINDTGQIVGTYNDATGPHAFLYSGSQSCAPARTT